MSYSVNIGKQQVSLFPYQELDSVYGNQILHRIIKPGVFDAKVSIVRSGSEVQFIIAKNSMFVFRRAGSVGAVSYDITAKIVLGEDAVIAIEGDNLWGTEAALKTANSLHLIADWKYDKDSPSDKYAIFTLSANPPTVNDGSTIDHTLLIAKILNHQAVVLDPSHTVSQYHVSYEGQKSRSYFSPLEERANNFCLSFDTLGENITVGVGEAFIAGKFVRFTTPQSIAKAPLYTTVIDPETGEETVIPAPSLPDYYQVDILRLRKNESTFDVDLAWDSYCLDNNSIILDLDNYTLTKDDIKNFLALSYFRIQDSGYPLAVCIRKYAGERKIWPENTIAFYAEKEIVSSFESTVSSRSTLAVFDSGDVVGL